FIIFGVCGILGDQGLRRSASLPSLVPDSGPVAAGRPPSRLARCGGTPGELLRALDRGARESIKLLLTIDRHSVVETTGGAEALKLLEVHPFDLWKSSGILTSRWMRPLENPLPSRN